ACLAALMQQLRARADRFATTSCTDMESLCSFVNDTDVLQVVELIDKIQFPGSADHADEVAKLNAGLGDALNATSSDIVALAVHACSLIVRKIFDEIDAVRPVAPLMTPSQLSADQIDAGVREA
ncbi:hypothetical protein DYB32_009366, partial [Aphanomyces invadans]